MRLILLCCLLNFVYQFCQCSYLSRPSVFSQLHRAQRSIVDGKQLAPFNEIVGIASENVPAYSNGNDSYTSNEDHFMNGVFMGMKWQCVEYARRWTYIRKGSVFESIPGASDMWDGLKYIERVSDKAKFPLIRHGNGSPVPPINESYLIYPIQEGVPYGHVAIIVEVLPNAIRVAEQNFYFHYWQGHYAREIPVIYKDGLYYIKDRYEAYGWMVIDDNQQLLPLGQLTRNNNQIDDQRNSNIASSFFSSNIRIYFYYFLFFAFIFYYLFY